MIAAITLPTIQAPYKGTAPAINDLVGGRVEFMFNGRPAALPLAETGKNACAQHCRKKRLGSTPDVPTVAESIPGLERITWYALLAPRNTPPAIIGRLNAEMVTMFGDPASAARFAEQGSEPQTSTPAEIAAYMASDSVGWSEVIHSAGLQKER